MSSDVTNAIVDYLNANPQADNEEVAAHVRRVVVGSQTTGASVSSVKSRLRKDGHDFAKSRPHFVARTEGIAGPNAGLPMLPESNPDETLEEAKERISVRYDAMGRMAKRLVDGMLPSLIISGPPGLGKSHTIRTALEERFPEGETKENPDGSDLEAVNYDTVSGSVSAVGLYQALWHTHEGGVLVLDDCDDVFRDETCLNLLKAALDSSPRRVISWRKEARWLEENGIPDRFDYQGHVVFLTNIDFEGEILKGKRDAEHFKALIDRSAYLCLTLRTRRDFMIRIRQVADGPEGMLAVNFGLKQEEIDEVLDFVTENQTRFYGLSLRLVGQIALNIRADPEQWKRDVEATKKRTMS